MYYIKIPLRHLCRPEELNVIPDARQEMWDERVKCLLEDVRHGQLPSWVTSYQDLEAVTVEEELQCD